MKSALMVILSFSTVAYAQETGNVAFQSQMPDSGMVVSGGAFAKGANSVVQGAPYSATITNESVQTLADGNRIVVTSTGTIARDSMGRTRHETALPAIGNLSPAGAPHLVFIQDPVTQTSYALNLTDKTAQKIPMPPGAGANLSTDSGPGTFFFQSATVGPGGEAAVSGVTTAGALPMPPSAMLAQKILLPGEPSEAATEDLGTRTIEGVFATGMRTTRTIPAGEIGNERPLVIVTEVWTSPDLKTIVSSKRSDPRMGEQTFQLTNLVRSEPGASLFAVPPDFKIVEGPRHIMYRTNR
jgi:hypothetical protein